MNTHYAAEGLVERVLALLPEGPLSPHHMAPLDQFHVGGLKATEALAVLAGVQSGMRVLDIGSGIGGPSRFLAQALGCRVTGIDLCADYVRLAEHLADRLGLSVAYVCGDALDLPFGDGGFDLVWTQHAAMNIPDRPRLHGEMARMLRPGGRLALHDVCAGIGGPLHLPVPWASETAQSALLTPEETRHQLEEAGFRVLHWLDGTPAALDFLRRAPADPPEFGLRALLGARLPEMLANYRRNLEEGRALVIEAVLEKS